MPTRHELISLLSPAIAVQRPSMNVLLTAVSASLASWDGKIDWSYSSTLFAFQCMSRSEIESYPERVSYAASHKKFINHHRPLATTSPAILNHLPVHPVDDFMFAQKLFEAVST